MHSDKRKNHLEGTRARARKSPVRSRMLNLYEKEQGRPVAPATFLEELTGEGWQVSLSQVTYHVRRLMDAELIPAPCHGG